MDLEEALRHLNINKGDKLDGNILKKKYREAVIKCHPDSVRNNDTIYKVNEANEILKEYLRQQPYVEEKKNIMVNFEVLREIYLRNDVDKKNEINKANTLVKIQYNISSNGDVKEYTNIQKFDKYGRYEIQARASRGENSISICGISREVNITCSITKVNIKVDELEVTFIIKAV